MSRETFSVLGQMLLDYLRLTEHYPVEADVALPVAQWLLDQFPLAETQYLEFDLLLTQQLIGDIVGDKVEVSRTVIPSYLDDNWGYKESGLPLWDRDAPYSIAFVYFPRSEGDPPQLDHYIWLLHELFHHVWSYIKKRFATLYQPVFEAVLFDNDLASLADRALAKQKSGAFAEQFARVWRLGDVAGWPLELAIDTFCLYLSGPAYLDAFVEAHTDFDPFRIDPAHPPVELRASALLAGATALGWSAHARELERLLETWRNRSQEASTHNRYVALRNEPLITACVESALALAANLNLPRLTATDLQRLEQAVGAREALEGLDLVVAAQLYTRSFDEATLLAWEERAVNQLLGDDGTT